MSQAEFLKELPLVQGVHFEPPFQIGETVIDGKTPVIIGGPCAVESQRQLMTTAQFIRDCGAQGLRGGLFKPRSSPYSFQGLAEAGFEYLAEARAKTGLFTVVEVTGVAQIDMVKDYADVLQIGSRNMQNFELLKAVGRCGQPVLLKRGLSATIKELLQAAEYILKEGNSRVILCERGIRTFETMTRNTLDINAIPLLKSLTRLPVFVDPSHGTGRSDLVMPVAKGALAAGADGLLIEVHPEPERALSDGGQSLNFQQFYRLMQDIFPAGKKEAHEAAASFQKMTPDLKKFIALTAAGYRYIPVVVQQVADAETPVTAFIKLTGTSPRFLLESVERGEQVGRYSMIGWDPLAVIKAFGKRVFVETASSTREFETEDPLREVQKVMEDLQVADLPGFEGFYGGAVGFLGYDYIRLIEQLPIKNSSSLNMPDLQWLIPRYVARFDHVTHTLSLIILASVAGNPTAAYHQARQELAQILSRLDQPLELPTLGRNAMKSPFAKRRTSMTREQYMKNVEKIKEYIRAGDAFQVVLSQRITQPFEKDPFLFYRLLRTINPSPYLFYLDFGQMQLAGSSPEVMVRQAGREVILKPIAGTRPRGETGLEDRRLAGELLGDEKECAEHVMLVDLGRNDLGRVCRFGTVEVRELMAVEYYSHVMHIVSTLAGELLPDYTSVDLLRAVFPAGTLSGAPKIRAMEIIEELESERRESYGGAVGYMGFNGNMDTCITIRTVLFKDNQAVLQVGAGIVADSIPEREYEETMNKAGALLAALERI